MGTLVEEVKKLRQGQQDSKAVEHQTIEWDLPNEFFAQPITPELMKNLSRFVDSRLIEYSHIYGTNAGVRSAPCPIQMTDEDRDTAVEAIRQSVPPAFLLNAKPDDPNQTVQPAGEQVFDRPLFDSRMVCGQGGTMQVQPTLLGAAMDPSRLGEVRESMFTPQFPPDPRMTFSEDTTEDTDMYVGGTAPADRVDRHVLPGDSGAAQNGAAFRRPLAEIAPVIARATKEGMARAREPETIPHIPIPTVPRSVNTEEEDLDNRYPFLYRTGVEVEPQSNLYCDDHRVSKNPPDRLEMDGPASLQELREGSLDNIATIQGEPAHVIQGAIDGIQLHVDRVPPEEVDFNDDQVDEQVCQDSRNFYADYRGFIRRNFSYGERVIRLPADGVVAQPTLDKTSYIVSYNIFARADSTPAQDPNGQFFNRVHKETITLAKVEACIITVPANMKVDDDIWYEYSENDSEKEINPIRRLIKANLCILSKSRAWGIHYGEAKFEGAEAVALEALRETITEQEFRHYLKYGFLNVRGQSGTLYQIYRDTWHIRVWEQGKKVEEICIGLSETPPTDRVIAVKTMIEADENIIRAKGNVYNMRKAG
jgi:hypothetical protein